MEAEFRSHLQVLHATLAGKTSGLGKCDCCQDKEGEKNEVRYRAERKPRRSDQQVEPKNCDDKSLFPFLSCAAKETSEHGQQCDSSVSYPTSGRGGVLVLGRLRLLQEFRLLCRSRRRCHVSFKSPPSHRHVPVLARFLIISIPFRKTAMAL